MNMKLVIIGTIFVVLLVMFGRNPVQEAREQRRKEIQEKGELVYEIEKFQKENQGMSGGFGQPGNVLTQRPNSLRPGSLPPANRYDPATVPFNPGSQYGTQPPADQATPPANSGYYPPPAKSEEIPVFDPSAPRSEKTGRDLMRIADGRKIQYYGTDVFLLDSEGNRRRIPDGRYAIGDGRFIMTVEGGERVSIIARGPN